MVFTYRIKPEDNLVIITAGEVSSIDDYYALMERILNDKAFTPSMHMLWDLRSSTILKATYEDFLNIKAFMESNQKKRGLHYRVALLVSKPVDYGLSRMYQTIAETLPSEVEVFKDEAAALEWIKEPGSGTSDVA